MHHFSLQYTRCSAKKWLHQTENPSLLVIFPVFSQTLAGSLDNCFILASLGTLALLRFFCLRAASGSLMMFYGTPLLPRRVQHILDKNPVPRSRIVHQHMGHGAYQLAVLNNRASAHG